MDRAAATGLLPTGMLPVTTIRGVVENIDAAGVVINQVEAVAQLVEHDVGRRAARQLDHVAEGRAGGLLRVRQPRIRPGK